MKILLVSIILLNIISISGCSNESSRKIAGTTENAPCEEIGDRCDLEKVCLLEDLGCQIPLLKELEKEKHYPQLNLDELNTKLTRKTEDKETIIIGHIIKHPSIKFALILQDLENQESYLYYKKPEETKSKKDMTLAERTGLVVNKIKKNLNVKKIAKHQISKLKFKQGHVQKLNIFEGLGIAAGYKMQVEPSFHKDYYTRVDSWEMGVNVSPGSWLNHKLPIGFTIAKGDKLVFARQFKKQKKAFFSWPYGLMRLPTTAKIVMNKLKPGDFVKIPATMTMGVSVNIMPPGVAAAIPAKAGVNAYIQGQFEIHVFRMQNNKVRLKIIALKKNGQGISVSVGYSMDDLFDKGKDALSDSAESMGMNTQDGLGKTAIDGAGSGIVAGLKSFLDMNILEEEFNRSNGNLFMIDYVFDLNYPEVQEAYNRVLGQSYKFWKKPNILRSSKKLDDSVLTDTQIAEDIYQEDVKLFKEAKKKARLEGQLDFDSDQFNWRIYRPFKAANEFSNIDNTVKIGINAITTTKENSIAKNNLVFTRTDLEGKRGEYLEYFDYPVVMNNTKSKYLFGFREEFADHSYYNLALTKADKTIINLVDMGYRYHRKDNHHSWSERTNSKRYLKLNLSPIIYNGINWSKEWNDPKARSNINFYYDIALHDKTWSFLTHIDPSISPKKYFTKKLNEFMMKKATFFIKAKARDKKDKKIEVSEMSQEDRLKGLKKYKRQHEEEIEGALNLIDIAFCDIKIEQLAATMIGTFSNRSDLNKRKNRRLERKHDRILESRDPSRCDLDNSGKFLGSWYLS